MAVINDGVAKRRIQQEIKRYEAVKKKADVLEKEDAFGSTWKESLSEKRRRELLDALGTVDCSLVVNVIDTHDFFNPINLFRDENGNVRQFNYSSYLQGKEMYQTLIDDCNKIINGEEDTEEDAQGQIENATKKKKTPSARGNKGTVRVPDVYSDRYLVWAKYFGRVYPLYDRYICSCCGKPKELSEYHTLLNEANLGRIEPNGKIHTHICKDCCKKLYEYLYFEKAGKNGLTTMSWFCSYMNICFDEKKYLLAKQTMDEKIKAHKDTNIIDEYFSLIDKDPEFKGKVFMESPNFGRTSYGADLNNGENGKEIPPELKELAEGGWIASEIRAYQLVVKLVGYDPYYYQPNDNRKKLYKDLLNVIGDEEMDGLKINGAIQIVLSFSKIREIEELYRKRWEDNAPVAELKALSDLKTKELDAITKFSKDNGFGEAYQRKKGNGENSFSGIMSKMNEMKFEDALVNMYDIETSSTIQKAADASFKAIFSQLNLSDAEVYQTCQDQLKRLIELQRENASLQEQLRLARKEIAVTKLEEQKREYDIQHGEEDEIW